MKKKIKIVTIVKNNLYLLALEVEEVEMIGEETT